MKNFQVQMFEEILLSKVVPIQKLRQLSWNGVPDEYRAQTWQILLEYLPSISSQQKKTLRRKRREYLAIVETSNGLNWAARDEELLRQINDSVSLSSVDVMIFQDDFAQCRLRRLLHTWVVQHPKSNDIQGVSDIAVHLFLVFLGGHYDGRDMSKGNMPIDIPDKIMANVEADCYWCLSKLLLKIQGHPRRDKMLAKDEDEDHKVNFYAGIDDSTEEFPAAPQTPSSPVWTRDGPPAHWALRNPQSLQGIIPKTQGEVQPLSGPQKKKEPHRRRPRLQRRLSLFLSQLDKLLNRIDPDLHRHFRAMGLDIEQFAFRWMNCLLVRDVPHDCVMRMWDTFLSEGDEFKDFHVYVCAALLHHFSARLKTMQADQLIRFLGHDMQNAASLQLGPTEINGLLSQSHVWRTAFKGSEAHLMSTKQETISRHLVQSTSDLVTKILPTTYMNDVLWNDFLWCE